MPILDIFDSSGEPKPYARLAVIAAMCFPSPRDSEKRAQYNIAVAYEAISQSEIGAQASEQTAPMFKQLFPGLKALFDAKVAGAWRMFRHFGGSRTLTRAPLGPRRTLDDAMKDQALSGRCAGEMLLFVLAHDKARPGDASLRAARLALSKHLGWAETKVRIAWEQFRGVAHLWAAYRLTRADDLMQPLRGDGLAQFLADAEFLRCEIANISRRGAANPFQPEAETWALPPGADVGAAAVAVPPFGPKHEKLLAEARPSLT